MSIAAVAAVVLGAAMMLAGAAKVAAGPAWPAQAAGLGAPRPAVPVVPWVEIVTGALLCSQLRRPVVAAVAVALLVSFSVLLSLRLAEGRHPPCACFGSWSVKPLGWKHLVRNAILIAIGLVAAIA